MVHREVFIIFVCKKYAFCLRVEDPDNRKCKQQQPDMFVNSTFIHEIFKTASEWPLKSKI